MISPHNESLYLLGLDPFGSRGMVQRPRRLEWTPLSFILNNFGQLRHPHLQSARIKLVAGGQIQPGRLTPLRNGTWQVIPRDFWIVRHFDAWTYGKSGFFTALFPNESVWGFSRMLCIQALFPKLSGVI